MTVAEWDQVIFFKKKEFDCKCGCGKNEMDLVFLKKLDDARSRFDFAFIVTSGYRCPLHNSRVSTTGQNGPHTTGHAADLSLFGHQAHKVIQQGTLGGWFTGIGLKQHGPHRSRFIHLDDLQSTDDRFRPTIWTYK